MKSNTLLTEAYHTLNYASIEEEFLIEIIEGLCIEKLFYIKNRLSLGVKNFDEVDDLCTKNVGEDFTKQQIKALLGSLKEYPNIERTVYNLTEEENLEILQIFSEVNLKDSFEDNNCLYQMMKTSSYQISIVEETIMLYHNLESYNKRSYVINDKNRKRKIDKLLNSYEDVIRYTNNKSIKNSLIKEKELLISESKFNYTEKQLFNLYFSNIYNKTFVSFQDKGIEMIDQINQHIANYLPVFTAKKVMASSKDKRHRVSAYRDIRMAYKNTLNNMSKNIKNPK